MVGPGRIILSVLYTERNTGTIKSNRKPTDKKATAIILVNHIMLKLSEEGVGGITPQTDEELLGDTIELCLSTIRGEFSIHQMATVALNCFPRCMKKSQPLPK